MSGSQGAPGWLWVLTPALAVGFVAAMFYLSTVPASNELDAVQGNAREALKSGIDRARKDIERAAAEAKPTYDFYRLLENQTVDVPKIDAYKSTPKDAKPTYTYRLQAGSFRNEDDAGRLRSQLLLEGLAAYQESNTSANGTWYRVFVGPFTNRSALNKAQDQLADFNISPLVLKSRIEEG